jgi:transposase
MFVKETKYGNGRVNLAIVEGHSEGKTTRQRTVRGLGYVDVLEKEHADPRAWAAELCAKLNIEKAAAQAAVGITIHPKEKIDRRTDAHKNIGCAIPLGYYNGLGIEKALRNQARTKLFDYDANAVCRLLVSERIIEPSSKLSAFQRRGRYFFTSDFSDDDVYRCLDFLADATPHVVAAMNRQIAKHHDRNLESAYYDVTNYYFEIDDEDDLRRNGISKEHRRKPIVQMGLMQDKDGIPLGFQVFAGNTSDCETLLPMMGSLKSSLKVRRVVMVADKGLNTSTNIAAITLDKNGFVFSQSIRGTRSTDELRRWVISDTGYRRLKDDDGGSDFKLKSRQDVRTVHIKAADSADGKAHDVDIDVKVVAFWSSKYDRRAKRERARVLEKAAVLVKDPSAYSRHTHHGAAKYVKNVTIDKKTGEMLEDAGKVAMLDTGLIASEEELDGYYCIVTSETKMADRKIIDTYRGLWRIEESFKVTKSYLSARPVFVWTDAHIRAHFLICYIALTVIRLIQYDDRFSHSAESIIDEIRELNAVHLEDNWWRLYHRSEMSDHLCEQVGIDLSRKNMRLKEIKAVLAQVRGGMPKG